jgi:glycosyltransferase involved in cell wall biosynthesis
MGGSAQHPLRKPRILMVLPQMPQDPASGAARTAQTALEMAFEGGFEVRALGTTASERGGGWDAHAFLSQAGIAFEATRRQGEHEIIRFVQRSISYTLLHTGKHHMMGWEKTHGRQFTRLFEHELATFGPDIVFTYGGLPGDLRRISMAQRNGARVAACVFNMGYLKKEFFDTVDAVLTPSEFLANRYREAIGGESTPLPTPLDLEDCLAPERDPIFFTMVNPSVEKGLFFFARLAEELALRHPEIAVLAIESRGTAGMVVQAGLSGGFDLRRHESILVGSSVPKPRDIFATCRALLVPSVWEEASGRVVAEALVNGVPVLVSGRGGLVESANGSGFVLPIPAAMSPMDRIPPSAEAVRPWVDVIAKLAFDESFYQEHSARAKAASAMYLRENLAPRYVKFFIDLLR